jgi:hypothetical protein
MTIWKKLKNQIPSQPSIVEAVSISSTEALPEWLREIIECLENGILLLDKKSVVQL